MDIRKLLIEQAVRGAHVLVLEVPGWERVRMRVELESKARGWRLALSPADADVLLICGVPGPELAALGVRIWEQLPGPRARETIAGEADVSAALDRARDLLLDDRKQRADASERVGYTPEGNDATASNQHEMGDRKGTDPVQASDESDSGVHHENPDHGNDQGHQTMDHEDMDMDMPMPGGIPLAGEGPDRDGLDLDVLHLPLGPVLPHWPAGLVLRCVIQGDVITRAEASVLLSVPVSSGPAPQVDACPDGTGVDRMGTDEAGMDSVRALALRRCDSAARLLTLAGWDDGAAAARQLRDALLTGESLPLCETGLRKLARRVQHSWLLRWSLSGLGAAGRGNAADSSTPLPPGLCGDVWSRLNGFFRDAAKALKTGTISDAAVGLGQPEAQLALLRSIPALVTGSDVAVARLIVASLDLDTSVLAAMPQACRG